MSLIDKIIREHIRKLHEAMDAACYASLGTDCGVKVTYGADGSYTVELSREVPPLNIYEYRNTGLIGYAFDPDKRPYVESMISSGDTP